MKRNWETSAPANPEDAVWVHMPSHPYASAYSSIPNPYAAAIPQQAQSQSYQPFSGSAEKKARVGDHDMSRHGSSNGNNNEAMSDDDEDDDDDDDDDENDAPKTGKGKAKKGDGKPKVKLTRGSRACIACRKIKMRCIPDENSGAGGPCKRCKSGGHECVFEESNRGKRSTRKNEALAAKINKMEAALRGIGAALSNLDQPSLNSFSNSLHSATSDPDIISLITSHTSPTVVPTLAIAMNRAPYNASSDAFAPHHSQGYSLPPQRGGEDSTTQPPLSPRLHSLPDNVLSPLGLLAEASLQNTEGSSKKHHPHRLSGHRSGAYSPHQNGHRPSPLSLDARNTSMMRGSPGGNYRMATSDVRGGEDEGEGSRFDLDGRGLAGENYFRPGGVAVTPVRAESEAEARLPELLTLVTREEIGDLFDIFFNNMAQHVPLIYREFHTPDLVLQRSQFLCTVICAIAARYYKKRPDLHAHLSAYAKRLTFEVPSRGYKSVEVCQAYLLMSVWTLGPEKTFEQDRTWLMLGMAIRMATDLNLHRKSLTSGLDTEEGRARDLEIINRERCWLHCFVLDRSLSAQMGKPYTLREDYIIRNACEASWHQQRFSLPSDRALAAYVALQQIMSRAIDSIYSSTTTVSGLRQDCDYMLIVRSAHEELRRWLTEWNKPDEYPMGNEGKQEYDTRAQFYFAYSSLVLYSFGLENAIERAKMDISFFLTNVYEAATRVCVIVKEQMLPKGYLPYLPDTNFVMCSYALLSLLKLLKPELRPFHDSEDSIFKLVSEVADVLEDCAADASHQPAIYAAFIREIVRKTREARQQPSRIASPVPVNGEPPAPIYDPSLLEQTASWQPGDLLPSQESHFSFIPQGGDMMILPSAAGPSVAPSMHGSPTASFVQGPSGMTPSGGWAEYLPTFMSTDGFDGWDGSMLLPGFGRNQITLSGGLLHSQFGSGIITPAQHTPAQSRTQSRAQTPSNSGTH
ncbi:hypothetical protein P7C73_g1570, partial [Tremellales sp. Uapishka_1]